MKWAMALSIAAIVAGGCAQGKNFQGTGGSSTGEGGEPSAGGAGAGMGGGGDGGTGNTTSMGGASTSSGMGGMSTSSGMGGMTTTSSSSGMTTSSTTTTTTSTGGCGPTEHECAGQCVGNTIQSGCLQSMSCTPCPTPVNGSAICTAAGACDVICNAPYTKQGTSCVCATQCCSVADCPAGETCSGGMCSGGGSSSSSSGGGSCNSDDCTAMCIAQCFIQMKFGIGMCVGNTCQCQCL
jgi:hypothetical protein